MGCLSADDIFAVLHHQPSFLQGRCLELHKNVFSFFLAKPRAFFTCFPQPLQNKARDYKSGSTTATAPARAAH